MIASAAAPPSSSRSPAPAGRTRSARESVAAVPAGYATRATRLRHRLATGAAPDAALLEVRWSARDRRVASLLALTLRAQGVVVSGLHVRAALAEAARARLPRVP